MIKHFVCIADLEGDESITEYSTEEAALKAYDLIELNEDKHIYKSYDYINNNQLNPEIITQYCEFI